MDHGYLRGEKQISRGGAENAESWGKEVRGKNRPLIYFGGPFSRKGSPAMANYLRASASPRDSYSGKMPAISAPAWITAIFEEKRKNLTRRRGELGKGSPGKKSTANLLWGDHIATTSSPPRDSYSGQMPPIRAPAWITATFEEKNKSHAEARRTRRVGERKSGEKIDR